MGKRVLVCAYFAKNAGDDLFLKILFDRYPKVKWDLLTANRNYNKVFKHYKNVRIIYSYREFVSGKRKFNLFFKIQELSRNYSQYDALLNIGGSIFMQGPGWKIKYNERKYLVNKFRKKNKKTFILGANFGPFKDFQFIDNYRELLGEYDDVCFRDSYSHELFSDLHNVRLSSDVVFTLKSNTSLVREKSVGFSIIDLDNRDELAGYSNKYYDKIARLIEHSIDQGYKVKLFSFCENEGDLKAIKKIKERVKSAYRNAIEIVNYDGNIEWFLKVFNKCEIILGTRLHSIILAILNGQNLFPILYSNKTYNLLKDLDMAHVGSYLSDLNQLQAKEILALAYENKIPDRRKFNLANKQFEKLDSFLL